MPLNHARPKRSFWMICMRVPVPTMFTFLSDLALDACRRGHFICRLLCPLVHHVCLVLLCPQAHLPCLLPTEHVASQLAAIRRRRTWLQHLVARHRCWSPNFREQTRGSSKNSISNNPILASLLLVQDLLVSWVLVFCCRKRAAFENVAPPLRHKIVVPCQAGSCSFHDDETNPWKCFKFELILCMFPPKSFHFFTCCPVCLLKPLKI